MNIRSNFEKDGEIAMKLWKKNSIILKSFLILAFMFLLTIMIEQTNILFADSENETTLDLGNFQAGESIDHTHIWETKYDEFSHWRQCNICNTTTDETAHILESNGGSKTLCANQQYNSAYREVCNCGYQSKPQVVLHGRYENYATSQRLNYMGMTANLSEVKQITYPEFQSIDYPDQPGGQPYTWSDPDGDGYGWVFKGGPILGDDYGTKGTIETILGSEGDCGRHRAFDEAYILVKYINVDTTPTLAEFINYLPANNTIPSNHLLYGYKEKYQKVTNTQFEQLLAEFKGYNPHPSGWGWTTMGITHAGHHNDGSIIYGDSYCYDSSNNHSVNFEDGIKTDCDLCGAKYNGNENYVANTWYRCTTGTGLAEGQSATCGGHVFVGKGNTKLGTVYDTFTKRNGTVTRTTVTAQAEPGFTATNTATEPYVLPKADNQVLASYEYVGSVTFSNNQTGTALIQRSISCGAVYPLTDDTAPTAYGYSNNATSNEYWKVTGNGTSSNSSPQASVTVTFKDPQQYSNNQLRVRVYDSDKTTILPQGNGGTEVPLTKVSGTSDDNTLWQGNINILAEIKGNKDIYVQAIDSVGNVSELIPMQISYLDSKKPVLTTSVNIDNNTWAKTKILTITATDAFDFITIGLDKKDMLSIPKFNNQFQRIYNMVGDVYDSKTIKIYVKDGIGNTSTQDVTIDKIDNTKPTITDVAQNLSHDQKSIQITITANDINESLNKVGSGIEGYKITTTNEQPTDNYQASNVFTIDKNGTYYVWVKDRVGNISSQVIQVVNIERDIDGTINLQIIDKETKGKPQANATFEGAVYGIYAQEPIYHADVNGLLYKEHELVATAKTDIEGKTLWTNLKCGAYYIKMLQPPIGYKLDETEYRIEIHYEEENIKHITKEETLEIEVKKQAIQIQKIKEDSSSLPGAGFSIYQISELDIIKQGKIERKTENTYILKDEVAKKDEYLAQKVNTDGTYSIETLIDYYYKIQPKEEYLEELPGDDKVYHPYNLNQEQNVKNYENTSEGEYIEELITDENGYIQSPRLAYGEYIVIETSVPREQEATKPFVIQIQEDYKEAQKLRIIIDENFRSRLKIYVKDATTQEIITNNESKYVIMNAKTKKLQTCITWSPENGYVEYGTRENPFVVGKEGILITPMKLEIGEYILEQVTAPVGYTRNWEEEEKENKKQKNIHIQVKSNTAYYVDEQTKDNVTIVNQINDPTKIQIETIDQETKNPVTGIKLQIQNELGETVAEATEMLGEKGKYEIQKLPVGNCKIVEIRNTLRKRICRKTRKRNKSRRNKRMAKFCNRTRIK